MADNDPAGYRAICIKRAGLKIWVRQGGVWHWRESWRWRRGGNSRRLKVDRDSVYDLVGACIAQANAGKPKRCCGAVRGKGKVVMLKRDQRRIERTGFRGSQDLVQQSSIYLYFGS